MNAPAVTQAGAAGAPPVSGKGGQGGGGVVSATDQKVAEDAQDREVSRDSILKLRTQKLRPLSNEGTCIKRF